MSRQTSLQSKSHASSAGRTISIPPSNSGWTTLVTPIFRNAATSSVRTARAIIMISEFRLRARRAANSIVPWSAPLTRSCARFQCPRLLDLITSGTIDPSFVITHRLPLDQTAEGYKIFGEKKGECIKVVFKPRDLQVKKAILQERGCQVLKKIWRSNGLEHFPESQRVCLR